jgi:restriction system protein
LIGRQNISEGSRFAASSSQTELRLVNTARSSLEELLLDYEDYLRQHGHQQWTKDNPEALKVRAVRWPSHLTGQTEQTDLAAQERYRLYAKWLADQNPAIIANTLLCLIHQANYLLDQQISALEEQFIKEGGYSEQLAAARIAHRSRQATPVASQGRSPNCPKCGKPLVLRTARKGPRTGSQFWGCSGWPGCNGSSPVD